MEPDAIVLLVFAGDHIVLLLLLLPLFVEQNVEIPCFKINKTKFLILHPSHGLAA